MATTPPPTPSPATPSEEDVLRQYGGSVAPAPTGTSGADVEGAILGQYGGAIDRPDQRYLYTTPEGIPVYTVAPPPSIPPEEEQRTFLHEAIVNPAKQALAGGYEAAAAANNLTANIFGMLHSGADKLSEWTGLPKAEFFKNLEDWARTQQQGQQQRAAELASGRQDLISQLYRGGTAALASLPTYAVAAETAGPVLGMAGLSALETANQGWKNALEAAAQGGLAGGALQVMGPAGRLIKLTGATAMTYAQLRMQGVSHETALANALTMGGMAAIEPGQIGVREMLRNVPEVGQNIRETMPNIPGAIAAGAKAAAPDVAKGLAKIGAGELVGVIPGMEWPARLAFGYPGAKQVARGLGRGAEAAKATLFDRLEALSDVGQKTPGQVLAEQNNLDWSKVSPTDRQMYEDIARAQANTQAQAAATGVGAAPSAGPSAGPSAAPASAPAPAPTGTATPGAAPSAGPSAGPSAAPASAPAPAESPVSAVQPATPSAEAGPLEIPEAWKTSVGEQAAKQAGLKPDYKLQAQQTKADTIATFLHNANRNVIGQGRPDLAIPYEDALAARDNMQFWGDLAKRAGTTAPSSATVHFALERLKQLESAEQPAGQPSATIRPPSGFSMGEMKQYWTSRLEGTYDKLQQAGDEARARLKKGWDTQLYSLFPGDKAIDLATLTAAGVAKGAKRLVTGAIKDMGEWGAARIAGGYVLFPEWKQQMLEDAKEISDKAAEFFDKNARQIYRAAQATLMDRQKETLTGQISNIEKILRYAEAGKEGINWYRDTKPILSKIFGPNTDLFLNFLAATSPRTPVADNVERALTAYTEYLSGKPFSIDFPAHRLNLERAVRGEPLSGMKVSSFRANLLGDFIRVTVDTWMSQAYGFSGDVTDPQYRFLDYAISQAAKRMRMQPADMQAAIWTGIKNLEGDPRLTAEPFEKVVMRFLDQNPAVKAEIDKAIGTMPRKGPRR